MQSTNNTMNCGVNLKLVYHGMNVKMAVADKPLEDFVLLFISVKGDATKYVVLIVSLVIMFLSHSSSILAQSCSAIS